MDNKMAFLCVLLPFFCMAQVGINTTSPNASLDIKSSNQTTPINTDGILIPKIDNFPATNPTAAQDGMLVYVTGSGTPVKGFYFWDHLSISWIALSSAAIQKINDLTDGKSDNDGSDNGSSIFLGIEAGLNDDGTNNWNIGIGYQSLYSNTSGTGNITKGYQSLYSNTNGFYNNANGPLSLYSNTTGAYNVAIGFRSLYSNTTGASNIAIGSFSGWYVNGGSKNVFLGVDAGAGTALHSKDGSVNIGHRAGRNETNSNRLYIENSASSSPLIYGEFDNDLLRFNGVTEVLHATDSRLEVKTNDGNNSSLSLFEGTDYGFELLYTGSDDKLNLWSRTFSGNEAERMTWLKDGRVGVNDNAPNASLDIEASNVATPRSVDGILIPRIDAFPTTNPTAAQNGMMVFLNSNNSFYYWKNSTSTWTKVNVERINDLADGKSDNTTSLFLGQNAGLSNTTGTTNTSVGYQSLYWNTIGSSNTAVGYRSMYSNTVGLGNAALGDESLLFNTTGDYNTAIGWNSLKSNTTGNGNTATGWSSLSSNTTGTENTATGRNSLSSNTIGVENTAMGWISLSSNTTGIENTAIGWSSLSANTTGAENTAVGNSGLSSNTTGRENTAIGKSSLYSNTVGIENTALGFESLFSSTATSRNVAIGCQSLYSSQSFWNTAIGFQSLYSNTSGGRNTAIGYQSLETNTTGTRNTAVGIQSLDNITSGNNNTGLGTYAGPVIGVLNNTTAVGYNAVPLSSNTIRVGNASVAIIGGSANWSTFSDRRLKTNIREDVVGLNFIKKLRPVSYNYNMNAIAHFEKTPDSLRLKDAEQLKAQEIQTGFIAQEVETAANAAGFNFHGIVKPSNSNGIYALRYAEFVVPLVKAMQEQQTIIEIQQEELDALRREIEEIKGLLRQD